MRRAFPGYRRLLAIMATLGLLMSAFPAMTAAVGAAGPPSGDGIQPFALAGNQNCRAADADFELRINAPADGPFTHVATGFTITLDVQETTAGQVFDYTSSGGTIYKIYVKAGPDTNRYDYGTSGSDGVDTGLHGTINPSNGRYYGLSHISICFDPVSTPTLVTNASANITIGGTIHDVATLSGATATAGGSITFSLYGPNDATCSGTNLVAGNAAFTVAVSGNGNYTSPNFTPTAVGTYRWIANYSGDALNNPTANTCNAANESVVVSLNEPDLDTAPWVIPQDDATLDDLLGSGPFGTLEFDLFNNATCTGDPVYTQTVTVTGDGTYSTSNTGNSATGGFRITTDGTFYWVVTYSGNSSNASVTSDCGDEVVAVNVTP